MVLKKEKKKKKLVRMAASKQLSMDAANLNNMFALTYTNNGADAFYCLTVFIPDA